MQDKSDTNMANCPFIVIKVMYSRFHFFGIVFKYRSINALY